MVNRSENEDNIKNIEPSEAKFRIFKIPGRGDTK
jgi:hypothetical protein